MGHAGGTAISCAPSRFSGDPDLTQQESTMPTESIEVSARFPVTPDQLFRAWLDSREHTRFTGGVARIDPSVGGRFSAWDDYITGRTLEIVPGRRIVQAWRTAEFPLDAPDSRLEARFESEKGGTRLVLVHTEIPQGHGDRYEEGWVDSYFEPMQRYFRRVMAAVAVGAASAAAEAARPKRRKATAKRAVRKAVKKKVRAASAKKRVRKAVKRKVARAGVRRKVRKAAGRRVVRAAARRKMARTVVRKAVRKKVRAARGRARAR
jgi:uncharacterized protein YndB with AHSA1/START domain